MTSIITTAAELHAVQKAAEQSFERGGYSSAVHDIYIHGYMEAAITERQKIAAEREAQQ